MDRPGERRKLGTETAECLRVRRATEYQVRDDMSLLFQAVNLPSGKASKIEAKLTVLSGFTALPSAFPGRELRLGSPLRSASPTAGHKDGPGPSACRPERPDDPR